MTNNVTFHQKMCILKKLGWFSPYLVAHFVLCQSLGKAFEGKSQTHFVFTTQHLALLKIRVDALIHKKALLGGLEKTLNQFLNNLSKTFYR